MNIELPYQWKPRDYQLPAWQALEGGIKRCCLVWHRRAGKDLFALNWIAPQAFQRVGLYWHILPTLRQGRKVVWDGKTRDGRPFLSHFPEELIIRKRDDDMSLWFANGSQYQVIGADDPDALVGANPVGMVFSEWSLTDPKLWELMRPILAENGGWAVFIYTPRGRNHGWRTLEIARKSPGWFAQVLTVDDTKSVPAEAIEEARRDGMAEEMIQQEFYCSFDAPLVGSYYGEQMAAMMKTIPPRIGRVPWEPRLPVDTGWDLGVGDATAIWFAQQVGPEVRLIDFLLSGGHGLDFYAKALRERPYTFGRHLVPHDAQVTELGTGRSRIEQARSLGIPMVVVPKLGLEDGINAVRALLPRCWIDESKCEKGIQALREYRKEWDPDTETFRDKPRHDWTSDPADALRTLAVGIRAPRDKPKRLAPRLAIV